MKPSAHKSALLGAFFYSFGALADKKGVSLTHYFNFTLWVITFMTILMLFRFLTSSRARPQLRKWRGEKIEKILLACLSHEP